MHDIHWIREHPDAFDQALARRGLGGEAQRLISIDERRRAIIRVSESWKARRNAASKEIGQAKAKKDEAAAQKLMAEVADCKTSISTLEKEQKAVEEELSKALAEVPNLPLPSPEVPDGKDEHDNVEHHHFGAKRNYGFAPKQHFELGEALGQMDFETAAKLSGARFVVLKSGLARLERALGQFMLDLHTTEHGYTEVAPPLLVRDETMFGTAQLPKFKADQFQTALIRDGQPSEESAKKISKVIAPRLEEIFRQANVSGEVTALSSILRVARRITRVFSGQANVASGVTASSSILTSTISTLVRSSSEVISVVLDDKNINDRLWLLPTAEVPLTNLVREAILNEADLPLRFAANTPCFRQEAGAAGKDTRGMIRQHQFTKVELVSITTPERSKDEHERMLSCAEEVLRRLDLHYRVVTLCAGDMGFASQKTYDIEVWLPGQNMYREISSCSVCGEFQARRMNARYRSKEDRQVRHVHTLNGSGVAVGRALIAVMETYQQQDGSIAVPDVLQGYMGGLKTIGHVK